MKYVGVVTDSSWYIHDLTPHLSNRVKERRIYSDEVPMAIHDISFIYYFVKTRGQAIESRLYKSLNNTTNNKKE